MTYYWYTCCPRCNGQGRLIITHDTTNKRLYLHCEECEMGWFNPKEVNDSKKGFLTLFAKFETEMPTRETIKSYSWEKYAINCFED